MPITTIEVPGSDRTALAQQIARRLREVEQEQAALLVLHKIYTGGPPPPALDDRTVATPAAPVPQQKPRPVPPNTTKPGGTTESIYRIAREQPGLTAREFIDRVEAIVNTIATDKRRTISSTLGTMVKKGTMHKRGGRFYVSPTLQNGDGQGREPLAMDSNSFDLS